MSGALSVTSLRVVRGATEILRGVDLRVERGEIYALMGTSGAGKSTVLRSVAALQPFSAGGIEVDGFALHPGPLPRESLIGSISCWLVGVPQGTNTSGR